MMSPDAGAEFPPTLPSIMTGAFPVSPAGAIASLVKPKGCGGGRLHSGYTGARRRPLFEVIGWLCGRFSRKASDGRLGREGETLAGRRGRHVNGCSSCREQSREPDRAAKCAPGAKSLPSADHRKLTKALGSGESLPDRLHVGGADAPVATDDGNAETNSRRRDDAVRHIGNVGAGNLTHGVNNFHCKRASLKTWSGSSRAAFRSE